MDNIQSLYPTAESLLAISPEDLAPVLLKLASGMTQGAGFIPESVCTIVIDGNPANIRGYSPWKRDEVDKHLSRAWNWIEREGFIEPAPGMNGRNGWRLLTDSGRAVADGQDFARLRRAMEFPKSLLHPAIRDKVCGALARGDLDDAVFHAFKTVEEAVRTAGGFPPADIGPKLMRRAFDKDTGPLTDPSLPEAEREAMAHLFAGAIGAYKNPHSHRTVNLGDLGEAQEQVVIASHLLRIVDARRPA